MDRFDVLKIEYIDTEVNVCGLCIAPWGAVREGDTVETAYGRAFVVACESYVSKDNPFIAMLDGIIDIPRVLFKIYPMKYEEKE